MLPRIARLGLVVLLLYRRRRRLCWGGFAMLGRERACASEGGVDLFLGEVLVTQE